MAKFANRHVKKGDEVYVISGAHKSREKKGKIIEVLTKKDRVIVEGFNMIKKHLRKSQDHPEGAIIEREGSIHISNVMRADRFEARTARKKGAQA
ncbi:50S ribosomal protein L24 [bacterium]|nr:50S ribosomal protein L24 [bacterium]